VLELKGLSKRFGGVIATDGVALDVKPGEVHALIGPNGAGKTTLVAQIAGDLASDGGAIVFQGADVTHAPQHQRVRAGLARSYQVTSIFRRLSVLDNLALAVQARSGSSFSFWRPVASETALAQEARDRRGDRTVGARGRRRRHARHGEQRAPRSALRSPRVRSWCCSTSPWPGWGRRSRSA
jgi:branched-chain amino acid transport system ATP-binding protein